jgi:hypothetical protein
MVNAFHGGILLEGLGDTNAFCFGTTAADIEEVVGYLRDAGIVRSQAIALLANSRRNRSVV